MNRFIIYSCLFVVAAIIYLLQPFSSFTNSFLFVFYLVSSFFLVFALETIPRKKLNIPAVHYYRQNRLNKYGTSMAGVLILSALLYYFATFYIKLNQGEVVLILWFLLMIVGPLINKITAKDIVLNAYEDFILENLKINLTDLERVKVGILVKKLYYTKTKKDIDTITKIVKPMNLDKKIIAKVVNLYDKYSEGLKQELISDEIEEVNKL